MFHFSVEVLIIMSEIFLAFTLTVWLILCRLLCFSAHYCARCVTKSVSFMTFFCHPFPPNVFLPLAGLCPLWSLPPGGMSSSADDMIRVAMAWQPFHPHIHLCHSLPVLDFISLWPDIQSQGDPVWEAHTSFFIRCPNSSVILLKSTPLSFHFCHTLFWLSACKTLWLYNRDRQTEGFVI